jgi:ubiquinone/menaquinone biosynthesis C-methylase UbiE
MPHDGVPFRNIADAYDRWAATYDSGRNPTRDLDADVVRRAGPDVTGLDVLEIGCGTGKNTAWLAGQARSVIALDFSPGMLARARQQMRSDNVRFIQHDVTATWPVGGESVDVVIGNLILEHVRDLDPIFAEAARVLRRGGQLFVCELHPDRQRLGGQARFIDSATGAEVRVAAYEHTVAEFTGAGIAAGLTVRQVGAFVEPSAAHDAVPRLLSVLFAKQAER